jgi:hypothetical protein
MARQSCRASFVNITTIIMNNHFLLHTQKLHAATSAYIELIVAAGCLVGI